ncbi:hypothetical protein GCM10010977_08700 [Citricoccus zhacaiensis]|uniref:Uncharacterized protein n=1 Tax=Citricoccus zhacaiensis TaxID=489142 RepID=A0ABQ2LSC0_9MICC|nr:hypothetical protein [Citricoccus zhacaiensis]GGO42568.1 hypothetical protein GCM10010977_08700 [Citricoccus zhacaiensis]
MSTPTLTPTSATTATHADATHTDAPAEDLRVITIPATDGMADSEPVHHVISASSYAADITDPAAETRPARTESTGRGPALLGMLLAMIAVGAFLTQFTDAGQEIVLAAMLVSALATAGITQVLALRARIHP